MSYAVIAGGIFEFIICLFQTSASYWHITQLPTYNAQLHPNIGQPDTTNINPRSVFGEPQGIATQSNPVSGQPQWIAPTVSDMVGPNKSFQF